MDKVIDYQVLEAASADFLASKVRLALKEGWTLHCGPCITKASYTGYWFFQAMVKVEAP